MEIARFLIPLKNEILNDPEDYGYSAMTDQEVADILNDKNIVKYILFPISEVHDWASAKRLFKKFADAGKLDTDLYKEMEFLFRGKQEAVNFSAQAANEMLDDLITEGIITLDDKNELIEKGKQYLSRAEEIGFAKTVTAEWVARCREVE